MNAFLFRRQSQQATNNYFFIEHPQNPKNQKRTKTKKAVEESMTSCMHTQHHHHGQLVCPSSRSLLYDVAQSLFIRMSRKLSNPGQFPPQHTVNRQRDTCDQKIQSAHQEATFDRVCSNTVMKLPPRLLLFRSFTIRQRNRRIHDDIII